MIKLSVLVPIYNVEKYIGKFLASLEDNINPNIEIIFVNDGTTDKSAILAMEFSKKYYKIAKVINKSNGGVSSARNKGLELAKGEYIIFADPDDFLSKDYICTILDAIDGYNNPDMIFFDYYEGSYEIGFKRNTVPSFVEGTISKERYISEQIRDRYIKSYLCNKAIKKNLYKGLKFDTNTKLGEDYKLLTLLSLRLEKIVYIPVPTYYYCQRMNSLSHSATDRDIHIFYEMVLERQLLHSRLYKNLSFYAPIRMSLTFLLKAYKEKSIDLVDRYENIIKENIRKIIFSKDFSFNEKKQCLLVYFGLAKAYYVMKGKKKVFQKIAG